MTRRQARKTQALQREAAAVKRILEQEALHGGTYALVAGELQHWTRMPRDGALVRDFMLMSDGLAIRLSYYLKRHGREFSTREEAEFVLFGEESSGVLD
ncbi:hypothetical protein D7V80_26665 [Corallococcus sp. CA054B]|uniref:hypothetical protein n=1 Tax=Corallococcus sp. CA054B TaxID=2316734 RepID=UPI000EA07556|nr:hypothetical protein [Corallococcus sp. CA054B]RKG64484.1 hypothetical protein D7V80_26665 [Corallococcus sp. CA054B]